MNRDPQTANRTSTKPTAGSPRHISRASRRITVTFNSRCSNSKGNYGRSPCIRTYVECTQQRGGNSRVTRERCGAKCYPTVVQRQKVPISILPERVNTSETDDTTHTHTHTHGASFYTYLRLLPVAELKMQRPRHRSRLTIVAPIATGKIEYKLRSVKCCVTWFV